jgi:hypothetical protein
MQRLEKEYIHGRLAVEAGRIRGIFPDDEINWDVNDESKVEVAKGDVDLKLKEWDEEMKPSILVSDDTIKEYDECKHGIEGEVVLLSDLWQSENLGIKDRFDEDCGDCIKGVEVEKLNVDQ